MTRFKVVFSRVSEKYLSRLTPSKEKNILSRIEKLSVDPFVMDNNIVKLEGTKRSFRLRMGNIRIIYAIDKEDQQIFINKIAPRGSAYSS